MLATTSPLPPPLQFTRAFSSASSLYRPQHIPAAKWSNTGKRSRDPLPLPTCSPSANCLASVQWSEKPDTFGGFDGNPNVESLDSASSNRHSLDQSALASFIQSCSNLREVRRVHALATKLLGGSVTYVDNNLISVYVNFADLEAARKLFDGMRDRSVVSWTAILNGYSRMGMEYEFLKLFKEMLGEGVQPNSLTFVCALNFCSKRLDLELGRQIHGSIVKGNWKSLIVDSTLIYFYAQHGDLSSATALFDRMENWDVVCLTTIITAYAWHGRGEEALLMFLRMQDYGFTPNEFTICSVLKVCGDEKALRFGRQLHAAIVKKMFKEDVFVGSSLVGMYVRCAELSDARAVFDSMPIRNTVTWTTMIAGYAQNVMGKEAILLFQRMKRRRIFINNLTVVSVLSACGSVGSLYLGKEVHGQILKNYVQGNLHIGSTLIWFYCQCGQHAYAARVLESMPTRDVVSWTAIISGFAGIGHDSEALHFLRKMLWEGIEPNPFTYSSALKACARIEAVRQGKWIHASISKTGSLPNVFVGSALISLYMKCGFTDDASRVFDIMPERNIVSWKAMIIGYAKNGLCGDALKLMYRMQAEGFVIDDYIFSTILSVCGDIQWESTSKPSLLMSS